VVATVCENLRKFASISHKRGDRGELTGRPRAGRKGRERVVRGDLVLLEKQVLYRSSILGSRRGRQLRYRHRRKSCSVETQQSAMDMYIMSSSRQIVIEEVEQEKSFAAAIEP